MTAIPKPKEARRAFTKVGAQRLRLWRRRPSRGPGRGLSPEHFAVVCVALMGCILAAAVLAQGGMDPQIWLACEFAVGVILIFWAVCSGTAFWRNARATAGTGGRANAGGSAGFPKTVFPTAILLLPLFALFQVTPLPPQIIAALSPARAELAHAVLLLSPDSAAWVPVSVHPGRTLEFAIRLAAYGAVFAIARGLSKQLGRHSFIVTAPIIAIAAVEAAMAVIQERQLAPWLLPVANGGGAAGAAGSYVNRNHLAGLLELALPFAIMMAASRVRMRGNGEWRSHLGTGVAAACAVLIGSGILATRSRAGLVAALISMLVAGALVVRQARGWRRLCAAVVAPLLLAAAFVYLPSETLVRRYGALAGAQSLVSEGRVPLWRETLDLAAAYPLVGCGLGAYEAAFLRYKRSAPVVNDTHAHNDYLELLAEAGLIGFTLCAALAVPPTRGAVRASLGSHGRSASWVAIACVASLAGMLAHSFVDFNLRIPANGMVLFWVLGICAARGDRVAGPKRGLYRASLERLQRDIVDPGNAS